MKKRYVFIILILSLLTVFYFPLRSLFIMGFYSQSHEKESIFEDENIKIKIKGGISTLKKDWYPFAMYFNDDEGFSDFIKKEARLSIIYNFGAFDFPFISSSIFNEGSSYFSSFYGAYAVQVLNETAPFGFDSKMNIITKEIVLVPQYDLEYLVINSFGKYDVFFEYNIEDTSVNEEGWNIIKAVINTNSLAHRYKGKKTAYLQYGRPFFLNKPDESFKIIEYYGVIYVKYIEEKNTTIFLYAISPYRETVDECSRLFLETAKIQY